MALSGSRSAMPYYLMSKCRLKADKQSPFLNTINLFIRNGKLLDGSRKGKARLAPFGKDFLKDKTQLSDLLFEDVGRSGAKFFWLHEKIKF